MAHSGDDEKADLTMSVGDILKERGKTHGPWKTQASLSYEIKTVMRDNNNFKVMPVHKQEALDMIAVKISRIIMGNWDEDDHWDDISGYAQLGKE